MAKTVTQPMEMTQVTQMLQWLEEERRKDKALIAALQEQVRGQAEPLAQQAAQIQELQAKMTNVQNLISKVTDFEETVSNYKSEVVFELDRRDETRKKEKTESDRLRKIEHEAIIDRLGELDKQIQILPRYEERLNAQRTEDQRLSESLQRLEVAIKDLNKRSDDRVQSVTYLEEQRRADNRRIGTLEHDTTELRKKVETLGAKLPLLEDTIQKQKTRIDEAIAETKKYEKPIEELRISDFQREQKMKQYLDQGEQVAKELARLVQQTQGFIEQEQAVKRTLDKAETFQARIEKRQNEVAEMQRLAEDRVKRQWEEWQNVQEKDRKKRQIVLDEQWRAQENTNQALTGRIKPLEAQAKVHQEQLEILFDSRRMDAHRDLEASQAEVERSEQAFTQARQALRGEK
jgi:DNA repair exonuclease SbcCD ATPase subunit